MASDVEDDDLEDLRKAALATLKSKAQPISSISCIGGIHSQEDAPWQEFPLGSELVPEYKYQPEPLPEPDLMRPLLDVSVPPPMVAPQLPQRGLPIWPIGFNNMMSGRKTFRGRGFPVDRRPFNPRSHHRSFGDRGHSIGDRGRSMHDRGRSMHDQGPFMHDRGRFAHERGRTMRDLGGRYMRDRGGRFMRDRGRFMRDQGRPMPDRGRQIHRGFAQNKNRGFHSGIQGRTVEPSIHPFPPAETENAGGNLIVVINPQFKDDEEKRDVVENNVNNSAAQINNSQAPVKPKLVLPQDKYHTSDSSVTVSEKSSVEPPPSKPRDKFSRYDDSDSEEDDDLMESLLKEDDIDKCLDEDVESGVGIVDQPSSTEEEPHDAVEATYEVEIKKLQFSDNEEEESEEKPPHVTVFGSSPVSSDNESVDLDALAADEIELDINSDNKVGTAEEDFQNAGSQSQVLMAGADEEEKPSNLEVSETMEPNEKSSDLHSSSSSSLSSSSSSSSSSSDSSSESEDDDKAEENEQKVSESNMKKSPSSVSSGLSAQQENMLQSFSPKENVFSASQDEKMLPLLQTEPLKLSASPPVTSPQHSAALSRQFSPLSKSHSPDGLSSALKLTPPQHRRSVTPSRPLSPLSTTSWSPRRSRSRSRVACPHWRSPSPQISSPRRSPRNSSFVRKSLSPLQSRSPHRRSLSPRHSPRYFSAQHHKAHRSPSLRRTLSSRQRSPLSHRSFSPRQRSPLPRRSLSPRQRSPLPRRSLSPRQRSPLPRRSLSPRQRSPLPHRSLSPRQRSPFPRRSLSPRQRSPLPRRSFSPRHRSPLPRQYLSPKQKSPLSRQSLSPKQRSPLRRRSLSPRQRSDSVQITSSSRRRSVSPRKYVSPRKRSLTPAGSPSSYRKRSRSPIRRVASPYRHARHSQSRNENRFRQGLRGRDHRGVRHHADRRYDRNTHARDNSVKHLPPSWSRDKHDSNDNNPRFRQSDSMEKLARRHTEPSAIVKDSHGKDESPQQEKHLVVKEAKLEEPALPLIDLDKLTPEERAKIEARRKKFSSDVKIDPAKKVSLKSIKERTKKRKKNQQESSNSILEKRDFKYRKKSSDKNIETFQTPTLKEGLSSDENDTKYAILEEDSDDSDQVRDWRLEGNKKARLIHNVNIPGRLNHSLAMVDSGKSRRDRNDGFHRSHHPKDRRFPNRHRERLPVLKTRSRLRDVLTSDDDSDETGGLNRLTSSIVTAKHFEPDIPLEKLLVEVKVATKEKKKKSKVKPDFSQVYSVPAKRQLETQSEIKAEEEPIPLKKKSKKKKKEKKKIKHSTKDVPEVTVVPHAGAASSDEDPEAAIDSSVPVPRLSVLQRLGKKVPLKPHKEKKKKKKKSHSDEEDPTELDAKIQKIKEKNAAIARRQREIELDKKKYG